MDELNAALGLVRAHDPDGWLHAELATIQSRLFRSGPSWPPPRPAALERVGDDDVAALERWIDRLDAELPPLTGFVLPGGSALGAQLHVARTVCRRAERRIVALRQAGAGRARSACAT